ncbi:acyltransferase [Parvibaculum sp.]|uniref:acyltransferase family protein n=1 Tax=Parvibaculum sp. TaxID=2024848 RepID=UPI001DED365C|nr:acyltransferase [Parvibaculum sp.]MBX3489207.1 acyltransferase [Parvibaculum sp.]
MSAPTIPRRVADVDDGRNNNFDLIRIIAAACVLVSHSFPIAIGSGAGEPLAQWTGYSLGFISVGVFFAISGYLITRSFDRRNDVRIFLLSRCLRIFPGLLFVLLATVIILGMVVTEFSWTAFLSDSRSLAYVPRNLSLYALQYDLPGVFEENPFGPAINGSLWTLRHEVTCYLGVMFCGMLGFFRQRILFAFGLILYAIFYIVSLILGDEGGLLFFLSQLRLLSLFFVFGVAIYVFRNELHLDVRILTGLLVSAFLSFGTIFYELLFATFVSYATIYVSYWAVDYFKFYRRVGDYSYGLYIYAFPLQQLITWLVPGISPFHLTLFALPAALTCAIFSWHLIERPSLSLVRQWGS